MTTTKTTPELAAAIERINASEFGDMYLYWDDAAQGWYLSDESDMEDLGRRVLANEPEAYSLWCSDTDQTPAVGLTITAGTGEDRDTGKIIDDEFGGSLTIAWSNSTRTTQSYEALADVEIG